MTSRIQECDWAVVIVTSATNSSERARREIKHIVARSKPFVLFYLENVEMTSAELAEYRLESRPSVRAYDDEDERRLSHLSLEKKRKIEEISEYFGTLGNKIGLKMPTITQKIFNYYPQKGIMRNRDDGARNVSFRVDTLINFLGGLYDKIATLANSDEVAWQTFEDIGRQRGESFASAFVRDVGGTEKGESLLKKWCRFDSQVGWGLFKIENRENPDTQNKEYTLSINLNFMIDKETNRRFLCYFVRGYCKGVIEKLLGIRVTLECQNCKKSRDDGRSFNDLCELKIIPIAMNNIADS